MVFYQKDFKEQGAVVHLETRNQSFLDLAASYKKMGVKNHAFMLALHDVGLRHVDPHDPDLTLEIQARVVKESKINPWYFFRECLKAPPISGSDPTPFTAKRSNIATYWFFFQHIMTFLVQLRQTGKSFGIYSLERYLLNIGCSDTEINHFTKDDKLKIEAISKIKALNKELPPYLRFSTKADSRNKESVDVAILNNKLVTHIMQASSIGAMNLGRGLTSPIMFFDELAYFINNFLTVPAALKATGAVVDIAKESGAPYGTILATTAGYLNTKHGAYAHGLFEVGLKFTEKLFDCRDEDELKTIIAKNSRSAAGGVKPKLISMEFNHRQLGFTDAWLREKMEAALSDGDNAETDYLNQWAAGSDTSPIKPELIDIMNDSAMEPLYTEITDRGFIIRWYIPEEEVERVKTSRHVVVALDTSDAVGKDDIAMVIRDVTSGKVLGIGVYNEVNIITFVEWLADLAIELQRSLFIIERRSTGTTIIDYLLKFLPMKGIDPFKKLFNWVVDEHEAYPQPYESISVPMSRRHPGTYEKYRAKFGYATSGAGKSSRDNLYGRSLLPAVKYTGHVTHDKELVGQVAGLVVKNGRIDHASGGHDDLVIAWLLSYWVLVYGRNLEHYDIQPRSVLSVVVNKLYDETNGDAQAAEEHRIEQEALKKQIEDIFETLRKETNDNKAIILAGKVKRLSSKLDRRMVVSFNVDAVLQEIEEDRKLNKRFSNSGWY